MRKISDIKLSTNQLEALKQVKDRINKEFSIEKIIIFGSAVRGECDRESDFDILIIIKEKLDRKRRNKITDIVYEENLKYDTNISSIVVYQSMWDSGSISVLPIHEEILKEGVEFE